MLPRLDKDWAAAVPTPCATFSPADVTGFVGSVPPNPPKGLNVAGSNWGRLDDTEVGACGLGVDDWLKGLNVAGSNWGRLLLSMIACSLFHCSGRGVSCPCC